MKKIIGVLFAVMAAVAVLVAVGYNYANVPISFTAFGCSGFNDISLSSVDYLSNDPAIGGRSWVLTVVQNCQGRYAVGSFDKDKLKDYQDNAEAQYDLKVTTSLDEQRCEYPIQVQGTPIYHMSYETKNLFGIIGKDEWKRECQSKPNYYFFSEKPVGWGFYDYTCFWASVTAKHGILGTPSTTFKSTIKLESHGETKTATISNQGPGSARIGDVGTAYWNGNLVTGDQCPIASDYRVSAAYKNGVWKTIDESKYQSYLGYDQSGLENCIQRYVSYGTETPSSCVSSYNSYESNALAGKQLASEGGSVGKTYGQLSNGKIVLNPVKALQYPMITLRLNVAWLGLFIPVGEPKVIYASSQAFQTGTTGIINAQVQNVGTGPGSFSVYATCPSPFSQLGTTQYLSLAPNGIEQISIPITATAGEVTTKTCSVCAQDRNNPDKKHCKDVMVTVKPLLVCTAGERRCNGNYIEQCNAQGTGWASIQECELGCIIENGIPVCQTQEEPICGNGVCEQGETQLTCPKDCGGGGGNGGGGFNIDYNTLGILALLGALGLFGGVVYRKRKKGGRVRYVKT